MEFSITQLLENFSDNKLVAPKAIEKKLGINDDDVSIRKLQVALDALEKVGILEKDKGRYRRLSEDGLVEGRLRCSSKGFCFAIQDVEGVEDIYVRESRLSTAWNGDRVLVKVTKDGIRRRSPEGEVRLIVERSNPTLLAKVKTTDSGYRAIPLDDRLLFEIELIADEQVPDLSTTVNKLVHLEIARYPLGSHPPLGKIAQVLGDDAESTADVDLVCCKHNLPRKFKDKALEAARSLPKALKKSDLKNRLDLRKKVTVEIGNAPAISVSQTKSGWELGIHIPDVATYVTPASALDEAARSHLRSFFLGETILPMLPDIEILKQPEHLSISVLVQLDGDGALTAYEIQPSVISVNSKLSYEEAQAILDSSNSEVNAEIATLVGNISRIFPLLRQQRPNSFSITLPQADTQGADEGIRGAIVIPEVLPIYGMVAETLVLADQTIAGHLESLALPAIFRIQSAPDLNKVTEWMKLLDSMGITLELADPERVQPQDFQRFLTQVSGMEQASSRDILKYLLLSLFRLGEYSLSPGSHFGLSIQEQPYVHATLPQHRYADLLTQRLLHLLFEEGRDRRNSRSKDSVDLYSSSCLGQVNWSVLPPEREREFKAEAELFVSRLTQQDALAHRASLDLDGLRKAEFMQARTGQNFYGIITGVQSYGFFVEIESLLVEGLVHVSSLKDDWYEFPQTNSKGKSRQQTLLVGRRSGRQYSLGDRVEVQVKSVDYYRQQIDLVAVVSVEAALEEGIRSEEFDEMPEEIDAEIDRIDS